MTRWQPKIAILCCISMMFFLACATTGVSLENKKKARADRKLGEAHLREGNTTMALRELLKAQKLDPEDPILQNDLGLVYMSKNKPDEAIPHFEEALKLNPDYSVAKNNLGSAYLALKKWDKAIPVLKSVTGDMLYGTPHFPLTNLGWAYFNKKDYSNAEKYLKEALDLQPDFYLAQLNLGRTYIARGRLTEARAILEKAAENNPKDPLLLLEIGRCYRLLGDYTNAKMALRGVIEYTDDSELAVKAANEMKKLY